MPDLTPDQRWLLLTMGGWQIIDALLGPAGVQHLMQSHWGGYRLAPIPGAPEWMTSFNTGGGKIVSPDRTSPLVTVTAAQINAYARTIPAGIRAKLEQIRRQAREHTRPGWCYCGRPDECRRANAGDPLYGDRHHPTDVEVSRWRADALRIRAYEKVYLAKALRLNGRDEPQQLDLFEAVS